MFRFGATKLLVAVLLFPLLSNALPIIDTVIVNKKEWAQVDLFRGLSWNEINNVCSGGVCDATGVLNGFDVSGWKWADGVEVGDFLFKALTPHPGGVNISEELGVDTLTPWLNLTGFRFTRSRVTISTSELNILGLTSDDIASQFGGLAGSSYSLRGDRYEGTSFFTNGRDAKRIGRDRNGAWLYRDVVAVSEPRIIELLVIALFVLFFKNLCTRR